MNRYRVYWNIRRKCFSIQMKDDKGRWRVSGHADEFVLDVVSFDVRLKGQARVRAAGVKNVHAYLVAEYITFPEQMGFMHDNGEDWSTVRYNPYRDDWFNIDGAATVYANVVRCRTVNGKPVITAQEPVSFPVVDVTTVAA